MTDEKKAPAPKKKAAPKKELYINRGKRKHFTEAGKVLRGETIALTAKQAKQYEGLELCHENSAQSEDS